MQTKRAFQNIRMNSRREKPRTKGVTEIRGPYYTDFRFGKQPGFLDFFHKTDTVIGRHGDKARRDFNDVKRIR